MFLFSVYKTAPLVFFNGGMWYTLLQMMYTDAHIHIADIAGRDESFMCMWLEREDYMCCAAAHSPSEFAVQEKIRERFPGKIISCFGVDPQMPDRTFLPFLEHLLDTGKIGAIGETGFDLFTAEFASRIDEQEFVWREQTELARKYGKPVVIHCRRALDRVFRDAKLLAGLPSVIFHSWPGSPVEAVSLLKRGIHCFFSLGKPLLQGNKRALRTAAQIPAEYLLSETDAPYQTLKGELYTDPADIIRVCEAMAAVRGVPAARLVHTLASNFRRAYLLD